MRGRHRRIKRVTSYMGLVRGFPGIRVTVLFSPFIIFLVTAMAVVMTLEDGPFSTHMEAC